MPVLMASSEGGVEIEEVAAETPEKIVREAVHPSTGLTAYQGIRLAKGIGLPADLWLEAAGLFKRLENVNDCSYNKLLVEMAFAVVLCFGEFP